LTCRVLGPTEVDAGPDRVHLGGPLPRRLITALIAAEGRPMSEGAIAEAVWGDDPPASPSTSLQSYVSRLRGSLGPFRDALERIGDGYRLRAVADTATFAARVERGRMLLSAHPIEAARAFGAALRLWRGTPYADLPATPSVAPARARLEELHAVAVEEMLATRLAVGNALDAVADLNLSVRAQPYRERRWELLILGLHRSGRQADALAALRRVRALFADDLGMDPGPALQSLERRLLAEDSSRIRRPSADPRP
jgi:DNA-binding SARP family transcriptional activator